MSAPSPLQIPSAGPVRLATAAALPSCTYANGAAGVGATLTATAYGALTVDGVAVALRDSILVSGQATGFQNGIYDVTTLGTSSAMFVLTRRVDTNTPATLAGVVVNVQVGVTLAGQYFVLPLPATAITIGTTALSFVNLLTSLATPTVSTNYPLDMVTAPTGSEATGTSYIVGGGTPTGVFAGQSDQLAYKLPTGNWAFFPPQIWQKVFVQGTGAPQQGPYQYVPGGPSFVPTWGRKDRADLRDWATATKPVDLTGSQPSTDAWNTAILAMLNGNEPLWLPAGNISLDGNALQTIGSSGSGINKGFLEIAGAGASHNVSGGAVIGGTVLQNRSATSNFIVIEGAGIKLRGMSITMAPNVTPIAPTPPRIPTYC